jgi:hypothetical protein
MKRNSWIVRLNFLLLAFFVVVMAIRGLHSRGMSDGIREFFGLGPAPTAGVNTTLDWCATRVVSLAKNGKAPIYERNMRWFRGETDELSPVAVEKWLGRNCQLEIERASAQEYNAAAFEPILSIGFVKGAGEVLFRAGPFFRLQGEVFRSPGLEGALSELEGLEQVTTR